jgi:hypothetical protein
MVWPFLQYKLVDNYSFLGNESAGTAGFTGNAVESAGVTGSTGFAVLSGLTVVESGLNVESRFIVESGLNVESLFMVESGLIPG